MVDAGSRELGQTKWTRREASDHRRRSRPPPPGGSRPTLEQKDRMKQNRRDRTEAPDMLPPHDEQAEFMLLACAVHKPDTLVSLTEELFYDRRAKSVFAAMQRLRTAIVVALLLARHGPAA